MAVLKPVISWYKTTNGTGDRLTEWEIGVVDTSTVSNDFDFLMWNNRESATDLPNMQNAVIMTKDSTGGNSGELVNGRWIEVKVQDIDTAFTPIGWNTATNAAASHPVKTTKSTTFNGVTSTPNTAPNTTPNGEVSVLGVANDGTVANSAGNFVYLTMHCRIPGVASSGTIRFRTRVTFQFM